MAPEHKTICVDFDGVIAEYLKGWPGPNTFGKILPGCIDALEELSANGWRIVIHTTRKHTAELEDYLHKNHVPHDYINFNPENEKQGCSYGKPLATVYLDDRSMRFDGDWSSVPSAVKDFVPWHAQQEVKNGK